MELPTEKIQQKQIKNGRWTRQQHEKFMLALMQYGKDWKKVEQMVETRSGSQVRSHAQKFFNKLGKPKEFEKEKHNQNEIDMSEMEQQHSKPSTFEDVTPLDLVSLIKKQSKHQGKVNIANFRKCLDDSEKKILGSTSENQTLPQLQSHKSFRDLNNILSAYQTICPQQNTQQDEGFLLQLTKKYKRYLGKWEDFDKLIDFTQSKKQFLNQEPSVRKRSFTLPEGSQLDIDDSKLEEIKKKIKIQLQHQSQLEVQKKAEDSFVEEINQEVKLISEENHQTNNGQVTEQKTIEENTKNFEKEEQGNQFNANKQQGKQDL